MFWTILIIIIAIVAICLDSGFGKLVIGSGVVALGLLFLRLITGLSLFVTLAKLCAIIMIVVITGLIVMAIIGS